MNDHPHDLIEVERRACEATGNPMHAIAAYALARAGGAPVPEWVLGYFDHVSRSILEIAASAQEAGGKDLGPKVARAMGLASAGKGSPIVAYHQNWTTYGMNVRHRRQRGDKLDFAVESVARDGGVSYSTVDRARKLFDELFPGDGIFPDEAL